MAQYPHDLPTEQYAKLWNAYKKYVMSDPMSRLERQNWKEIEKSFKRTPLRMIYNKLSERGIKLESKTMKEANEKLGNTGIVIKQKGQKYYFDLNGENLTGEYYSYIDNVLSPNGIVMAKKLNGEKTKIDIYSYIPEDDIDENKIKLESFIRKIVNEERQRMNENQPTRSGYTIVYYETVGGHGDTGKRYADYKSAMKDAIKNSEDPDFMDGLEYLGVEPFGSENKFAILYIEERYLNRVANYIEGEKNKQIWKSVAQRVLQGQEKAGGKLVVPQSGMFVNESKLKLGYLIHEKVLNENPQHNKIVKSLLTKWMEENASNRQEYLYLLSKITEEALRDANFYHNGVLTKIPNIFRVNPEFDGGHLDKVGFKFGTIVSEKCDYIASDIIGAIEFFLRMNGYHAVADNLVKLLEE